MKKVLRLLALTLLTMLLIPQGVFAENEVTMPQLVDIEQGTLMGTVTNGTYIFKGIPYAKAERFQMPEPADSWEGILSVMCYGESAPQDLDIVNPTDYCDPSGTNYVFNERCQFLNVWTQSVDETAKKPVIFWIHGGGWTSGGSNELSYYDGASISASQDVVFVSINHRLNVLGYTDLSAYGEEYKYSGNVGVADMVMALEWVQQNIKKFGGDPENVTLVGQSGGGAKVTTLMGIPAAKGLFHKVMICSGGIGGIDQSVSQEAGRTLVEKCKETYGLSSDEEALEMLTTMPYDELYDLSQDTGVGEGSVVDGDYYPVKTISDEGMLCDLAKDYPVVVTTTFSEIAKSGCTGTIQPAVSAISQNMPVEAFMASFFKAYMTEDSIAASLEAEFGENKDAVLEAFHEAFPDMPDENVLFFDNSDLSLNAFTMLDAFASQGNQPTYRGYYDYEMPLFGGIMAPHTGGDLPFLFNNVACIDYMVVGDEEGAQKTADFASAALANFARTGNPSVEGTEWPAYTESAHPTMIIDEAPEIREDFDTELREAISAGENLG